MTFLNRFATVLVIGLALSTPAFAQEVPKAAPPTPEEIAASHDRYTDWAGGNACLVLGEDGTTSVETIDACALIKRITELETRLAPKPRDPNAGPSHGERIKKLEEAGRDIDPIPGILAELKELREKLERSEFGLPEEISARLKSLEEAVTALKNAPQVAPVVNNITNVTGGGTRFGPTLVVGRTRQEDIPDLVAPDLIHGGLGLTFQVGHADRHESEPFFAATGAPFIGTDRTLGGSGHIAFGYGFRWFEVAVTFGGQGYGVKGKDSGESPWVKARAYGPNAGLSMGFVLTNGLVLNLSGSGAHVRLETSQDVIKDTTFTAGASLTWFAFGGGSSE